MKEYRVEKGYLDNITYNQEQFSAFQTGAFGDRHFFEREVRQVEVFNHLGESWIEEHFFLKNGGVLIDGYYYLLNGGELYPYGDFDANTNVWLKVMDDALTFECLGIYEVPTNTANIKYHKLGFWNGTVLFDSNEYDVLFNGSMNRGQAYTTAKELAHYDEVCFAMDDIVHFEASAFDFRVKHTSPRNDGVENIEYIFRYELGKKIIYEIQRVWEVRTASPYYRYSEPNYPLNEATILGRKFGGGARNSGGSGEIEDYGDTITSCTATASGTGYNLKIATDKNPTGFIANLPNISNTALNPYVQDSGWRNLTLASGFTAVAGYPARYRKIGKMVQIVGAIQGTFPSGGGYATITSTALPVAYRQTQQTEHFTGTAGQGGRAGVVGIGSNGVIRVASRESPSWLSICVSYFVD